MSKNTPSPAAKPNASAGRSRLGRGLSSLMQVPSPHSLPTRENPPAEDQPVVRADRVIDAADAADGPLRNVPTDQVQPNPHQPRKDIETSSLADLAASIKTNGIIQPLVVVERANGRYELIAGERRLRAAKLAGLATVPVVVRSAEAHEQAQLALVENIQREDLNPIDRADAYKALQKQLGLTQSELAERVGEERSSVANHLRLLDLIEPVRQMVRDGRLALGHAKVIAGVVGEAEQVRLAELCTKQGLSVRNLERLVKGDESPAPTRGAATEDGRAVYLNQLADNVSRSIGMRCSLSPTGKSGGKLVVHFASLDQFDRLMDQLGIELE